MLGHFFCSPLNYIIVNTKKYLRLCIIRRKYLQLKSSIATLFHHKPLYMREYYR